MTSVNDRYIGQLIRAALDAGNKMIILSAQYGSSIHKPDGWQCSMKRDDGSFAVDRDSDPLEAVYKTIVPWRQRQHQDAPDGASPFAGMAKREYDPNDLFRPLDAP